MSDIVVLVDKNNIVKNFSVCLYEGHVGIENEIKVQTDLKLNKVYVIDNYKLVDGKIVELTEEEKETSFPTPIPQPTEIEQLKQQLLDTQNIMHY